MQNEKMKLGKEHLKLWMEEDAYEEFVSLLPENMRYDDLNVFISYLKTNPDTSKFDLIMEYVCRLDRVLTERKRLRKNFRFYNVLIIIGIVSFLLTGIIYAIYNIPHDLIFYCLTITGLILVIVPYIKENQIRIKAESIKVKKVAVSK